MTMTELGFMVRPPVLADAEAVAAVLRAFRGRGIEGSLLDLIEARLASWFPRRRRGYALCLIAKRRLMIASIEHYTKLAATR